jgi:hemolysin activation/secretion protein
LHRTLRALIWGLEMKCINARSSVISGVVFLLSLSVSAQTLAAAPGPAGTPGDAHFDVSEIRVLGNSVLPPVEVERAVYPFVGPNKTIGDLNAARAALESAYHKQGYGTVFVDLPEQRVVGGLIRLKVTEGRLEYVRVTGSRYFSDAQILAAVPEAKPGVVPNLPKLQEQIGAANAVTANRSIVPVVKAGSEPGTVDMTLKVQDHLPIHASVELNNQQSEGTKPLRGLVSFGYDNLFGRFDQFSFQYQDSPQAPGEVGVLATSLAVHLYDGGPALSMYYINSKTDVVATGLGVLGKGSIYGVRLPLTFVNRADFTSTMTFGADYKHYLQSIAAAPGTELNTPISYVMFSGEYFGAWRTERLQTSLDTSVNFGSPQVVNDPEQFAAARYQGRPNFFYLRANAAGTYELPGHLRLSVRVGGQEAIEPLVTYEYYSIAGADGVRGYLEAEEFGDKGIKGTVQLGSPQWRLWSGAVTADMFAFFDDGHLTFLAPLPGQPGQPGQPTYADLRSVGAGIDLLVTRHFTGSVTWAYPLVTGPYTASGDSRLLFVVRGSL